MSDNCLHPYFKYMNRDQYNYYYSDINKSRLVYRAKEREWVNGYWSIIPKTLSQREIEYYKKYQYDISFIDSKDLFYKDSKSYYRPVIDILNEDINLHNNQYDEIHTKVFQCIKSERIFDLSHYYEELYFMIGFYQSGLARVNINLSYIRRLDTPNQSWHHLAPVFTEDVCKWRERCFIINDYKSIKTMKYIPRVFNVTHAKYIRIMLRIIYLVLHEYNHCFQFIVLYQYMNLSDKELVDVVRPLYDKLCLFDLSYIAHCTYNIYRKISHLYRYQRSIAHVRGFYFQCGRIPINFLNDYRNSANDIKEWVYLAREKKIAKNIRYEVHKNDRRFY